MVRHVEFLLLMVFSHIVDDCYLQGWLASAKQKEWWKKNAPQPLYKHDYLVALLMHSISWSTMIMFPILFHNFFIITYKFLFMWLFNVVIHFITDNEKANNKSINLIQDQLIHMIQIGITFYVMFF